MTSCPICNREVMREERLVLEYLPDQGHWVMLHLVKVDVRNPNRAHTHARYPGWAMHCGQSAVWVPRVDGGSH